MKRLLRCAALMLWTAACSGAPQVAEPTVLWPPAPIERPPFERAMRQQLDHLRSNRTATAQASTLAELHTSTGGGR